MMVLAPTSAAPATAASRPAAADDGHGVVAVDRAGVDGRPDTGHYPAPEQSGHRRVGLGIDLGALAFVDQRLLDERTDAERRREFGAVGQRHLLGGVVGVETEVWATALAGPALAAHRTPVQDHEIAGSDVDHTVADRFDSARGLVTQQKRIVVVDAALAVGQVGMADPQAMIFTTTSPGPGSGITMSVTSTGSPWTEKSHHALSDSLTKSPFSLVRLGIGVALLVGL